MSTVSKKHHSKGYRKALQRADRRLAQQTLQPLPPLEQPNLSFFSVWYHSAVIEGLQKMTWQRETQLANQERWKQDFASIACWQRIDNLDRCAIKYLHRSALAMCEAVLAPDGDLPSLPHPFTPLWLQPLTPLYFRGHQVRGLFLYKPLDLEDFDRNPHLARMTENARAFWHDFLADENERVALEIVTYDGATIGPEQIDLLRGKGDPRRSWTHQFADWNGAIWRRMDEYCPSGRCATETIGSQMERILCAECREELDFWTRMIKTLLWIMQGKFRHAHDETPIPEHEEEIEIHPAIAQKSTRKRYAGEIVRFDGSYFRPTHRQGVSLLETHRIVSSEEAKQLGEIDLDNVLIKDFTDVGSYKRTLHNKKYYPHGQVPSDPQNLRQVDVCGKDQKRVYVSLVTWRAREAERSKRRKQTVVYASDFSTP